MKKEIVKTYCYEIMKGEIFQVCVKEFNWYWDIHRIHHISAKIICRLLDKDVLSKF